MIPRNAAAAPVDGAAAVGEVASKKRSSPTTIPSTEQPPKRKGGGPHRHASKFDGPVPEDAARPYSTVRLTEMNARFLSAITRAHPERGRS